MEMVKKIKKKSQNGEQNHKVKLIIIKITQIDFFYLMLRKNQKAIIYKNLQENYLNMNNLISKI